MVFLIPVTIMVIAVGGLFGGALIGTEAGVAGGAAGLMIGYVAAFIIGLYLLYRIAQFVSGHEKKFGEFERVDHMDRKESTIKWIIFGLIPLLNLYFLWRTAEMVSGHEVVHS